MKKRLARLVRIWVTLAIFCLVPLVVYRASARTINQQPDCPECEQDIIHWTQIIEENPDDFYAYLARATAYSGLRVYDRAVDDFNRAIELCFGYRSLDYPQGVFPLRLSNELPPCLRDPAWAYHLYLMRGIVCADQDNYEQAVNDFTAAIEYNRGYGGDSEAYLWRGIVHTLQDNYEQAVNDFTAVIEYGREYDDVCDAYARRGYVYALWGYPEKAVGDYTQAIIIKPDYAHVYLNRGYEYAKVGNYQQAIKDYNKAEKLGCSCRELIYANRSAAYRKQGNIRKAAADYLRFLKAKAGNLIQRLQQ